MGRMEVCHNMPCNDLLMLAACIVAAATLHQRAASFALCANTPCPWEARTGALSGLS